MSNPVSVSSSPSTSGKAIRVLVVDDDDGERDGLAKLLRTDGFIVDQAADGAAALRAVSRCLPDVVMTDLNMPAMGGVDLCEHLHELDVDLPVVLFTGLGNIDAVVRGMRAGAVDFLTKPLQPEAVVSSVLAAVGRRASNVAKRTARASAAAAQVLVHRGQPARIANDLRDADERLVVSSLQHERAEVEARRRARLDALLENLGEGVVIADARGQIRMLNGAACSILGIAGRPFTRVDQFASFELRTREGVAVSDRDRPLACALRGEHFEDRELLFVRPDGEQRRVLASGTHVKDDQGQVEQAILVFRDITDLRRLELQREDYATLISHDLRNPLNSILLLAATIRSGIAQNVPVERTAELAERIERNVIRMSAMVEEILEASQFEAGAIVLRREFCDVKKLVTGIVARLEDARARRIVIEADDAPCTVMADVPRLDRAITNLLVNAFKYSPDDAIVTVALERKGPDVLIHVVDRGIGLEREELARLFDRYYRAPGGKPIEGVGLGLYITRLLVEAHGGRVAVESAPGKGSSFTLVLPSHSS